MLTWVRIPKSMMQMKHKINAWNFNYYKVLFLDSLRKGRRSITQISDLVQA